jgi:uncharacterized damage-inducible protein DinB
MSDNFVYILDKHLQLLEKSMVTLRTILSPVSQADATTYRDGADGWTTLEIVRHLLDYEEIFYERFQVVLNEESPTFIGYDVDALAQERAYNQQQLAASVEELAAARERSLALFRSLSDEQWLREGVHPSYGRMNLQRILIQTAHHQMDHIEQITRVLAQR